MRRAKYTTIPCRQEGCPEYGRFEYDNQAHLARIYKDHANWKCIRHGAGKAMLAVDNPSRSTTLEVVVLPHLPKHRFWREVGSTTESCSGFVYGPGFQAHAEDFPPGTRLTVTATLEIFPTTATPTPESG